MSNPARRDGGADQPGTATAHHDVAVPTGRLQDRPEERPEVRKKTDPRSRADAFVAAAAELSEWAVDKLGAIASRRLSTEEEAAATLLVYQHLGRRADRRLERITQEYE